MRKTKLSKGGNQKRSGAENKNSRFFPTESIVIYIEVHSGTFSWILLQKVFIIYEEKNIWAKTKHIDKIVLKTLTLHTKTNSIVNLLMKNIAILL